MKTILLIITLFLGVFWITYSSTYAASWVTVQVTEKMPWMTGCTPDKAWADALEAKGETVIYDCKVKGWFASVQDMLAWMIKYFTFIAGIWGVLFLVVNGIMYSMGWMDAGMKDEAKKRIWKTLSGLVVLLLSWVILNLVAPWIYT
jgi:hypothetical protein